MLDSNPFESFGPSFLADQTRGDLQWCPLPDSLPGARRQLRTTCPGTPGVYGWLNAERQLLYVGKSKFLRHRLVSYFATQPSDPKMARIRSASAILVWEPIADELLALLREQELIHRWRPEFNSQGQPIRRQPAYVCLSDSAAPHAYVAKKLGGKYLQAFGPIAGSQELAESVTAFNYVFGLRDCPDKTPFEYGDQLRLFGDPGRAACLRYELGSCPGPCAALCTRQAYQRRLQAGLNFLSRGGGEILKSLEIRMLQAGARLQFERAATLRDQFAALSRLDRQLGRLRIAERTINGILPVIAHRGRQVWLVFRRGQLVRSIVQPRSRQQAIEAAKQLERLAIETPRHASEILDINLQLIVSAWFRKHRQRLDDLISFEAKIKKCLELKSRYETRSA